MKTSLTDLSIQRFPEGVFWDTNCPGFPIRIGKHRKTFIVMKGKNRLVMTLGRYLEINLREARAW